MHVDVFHQITWPVSRCETCSLPSSCCPTSRMAADARRAAALTHNPLLLCSSESTERGINPLPAPKSARSYLHKDIGEPGGEHRGAPLLCLFNDVPPLTWLYERAVARQCGGAG